MTFTLPTVVAQHTRPCRRRRCRHAAFLALALLALLAPGDLRAQPDPRTLPRVQQTDWVKRGTFTLPEGWHWGEHPMAVNGDLLIVGCHITSLGVVRIPALGGTAAIVEPCTEVPVARVKPSDPNGHRVGGVLWWNGRLLVSGYAYYNNGDDEAGTHFVGESVQSLTGPTMLGKERPGFVSGYMGFVPPEWRALLGGAALAGQCCIPIISRTSLGPSASVFDPDTVGRTKTAPATWLLGYPIDRPTLGVWEASPPGRYYGGSDQMGAVVFPAGTRSVLFVGRHGSAFCYGTGEECGDPTDSEKGNHGHPYESRMTAYDANDLLAVKLRRKRPWDVRPYASWPLPDMPTTNAANLHRGGFYDPATRRLYLATSDSDTIHVFEFIGGATARQP